MKHMSWSYDDLQCAPTRHIERLGELLKREFDEREKARTEAPPMRNR